MGLSFTVAALASAVISRSESQRTHDHTLLSPIRDSLNREDRVPYLYSPGTGWPGYTPSTWFPFLRLLRLAGLRWRYSTQPPHGIVYWDLNFAPLITPRRGPTEDTTLLLLRACLLGFPRDRYSASPLAWWMLPSNSCYLIVCFAVFA
jgi:hypothetical protein